MDIIPPFRFNLGDSAYKNHVATIAIFSKLEALDHEAKNRREVLLAFAKAIDATTSSFKDNDRRNLAQNMSSAIITFLTTLDYVGTHDYVPIRARSFPTTSTSKSASQVTFAEAA